MFAGEDLVDPESDHQDGQADEDIDNEFLCQFYMSFPIWNTSVAQIHARQVV